MLSALALLLATFAASAPLKVGLVLDVGGRGDHAFNDSAYAGLERARKELGAKTELFEPVEPAEREDGLRKLAAGDSQLIVAVGFSFTDAFARAARDFPAKSFACVDCSFEGKAPTNVSVVKFREQEGAFLGGALAALTSKTGTIGFIGGMDAPLIRKFETGYEAGARWAAPGVKVLSAYVGLTPDGFRDPAKGKELALTQYERGADIVFHAAGATGAGVLDAAQEARKLVIGVDVDQRPEAPGFVLTSVIKRVDEAVFELAKRASTGRLKPGLIELGLKEGGVGYVYDESNKRLLSPQAVAKAELARSLIVAGKLDAFAK